MKRIIRATLTALGLLPFSLFADDITNRSSTEVMSEARVIAELQQGQKTGGLLDGMLPLYGNNDGFVYADLQAYQYGQEYQTFGAGIGQRQVYGQAIYGWYGFFDRQQTPEKQYYNRINLGFERLGLTWDFRTNLYYYPSADKAYVVDLGQQSATVSGNNILYTHAYEMEQVYSGGDIEIGHTLGMENLRGYIGYYRFSSSLATNEISGVSSRIAYQVTDRVGLNASTQYDAARGWLTTAGIEYWLGKTSTASTKDIRHRLTEAVHRDMTTASKLYNPYTEVDVDPNKIYFASPTGSSTAGGTQAAPMDLDTAVATAQAGDRIYLLPGSYTASSAINLKANQTLWGSGADLLANGLVVLPGSSATPSTITSSNITACAVGQSACAIYVTNASTYGGFALETSTLTADKVGILVGNAQNVTLSYLAISGYNFNSGGNSAAVQVDNVSANVTLTGVQLNGNDNGLWVRNGTALVNGTGNTFNNNVAGIEATTSNAHVTVNNATIDGNEQYGVYVIGGTAILNSSTISNTTSYGMYASGSTASITATGLSLHTSGIQGIYATSAATMTIASPIQINDIVEALGTGTTITITQPDQPTISLNSVSGDKTCTTTEGVVSCA